MGVDIVRRDFQVPSQLLAGNDRAVTGITTNGALDAYGEVLDPAASGGVTVSSFSGRTTPARLSGRSGSPWKATA